MAEALVLQIVYKLGSIVATNAVQALSSQLGKEVSILIQVKSQIKQIESELYVMHPFLYQAQRHGGHDATLQAWLQQVQNLAFEIEDIIDEYTSLVSYYQSGFQGFFKNTFQKSKNIKSWHKVATELREIQNRLHNLSSMKDTYNITLSKECDISYSAEGLQDFALSSYYNELVGVREEREKIMQYLMTGTRLTTIISVWGMGGSGKTTLVRNIYESKVVKEHFDYRMWVSISQKYQIEDILRRMVKIVLGDNESPVSIDSMTSSNLVKILQRNLQDKIYLIVLDDVWSREVWIKLYTILGEINYGGRIVITTRLKDVAELATENHDLVLRNLHKLEAWDLFCRWVFRNSEDKRCPKDLEQWGRKIVEKCHGLPLAIVVAGNLLSFRKTNVAEWKRFYNEIKWELHDSLDNQNLSLVARVLNLSYNHLPSHLKSCFLLCSIFPEDYLIYRKQLTRLWVAEGLVAAKSTKTLEEVAEEYLDELVSRCMLKIVERNDFGRAKVCQMHDLVREFAILKSLTERFCMTYDQSQVTVIDYKARRLSVNGCGDSIQSSINFSHLRSFYLFDSMHSSKLLTSWVPHSAQYLRVLDLRDVPIEHLSDDVMHLFNLHHLGLRNTKVRVLPNSLHRLCRLQTLDVYGTAIQYLPSRMSELKQLRHLFVGKILDKGFRNFHSISGVEAPKGVWDLQELQTLRCIKASKDMVRQLGNLRQIRTIRIRNVKSIHCNELFTSISKMHFLCNLGVIVDNENEYLKLEALTPPRHLQKLCLEGRLSEGALESPLFHAIQENLKWLALGWNGLKNDPLASLSSLSNLTMLRLQKAYVGESLVFRSGWFPKLKRLVLVDLPRVHYMSIDHAMQNLEQLKLVGFPELKEIPHGIEFLASLQEIYLWDVHLDFIKNIQTTGKLKVKHIPMIKHVYQDSTDLWTTTNLS